MTQTNDREECGFCGRRWWFEIRAVDGQFVRIHFCTKKHVRTAFANVVGVR